MEIKDSLRQYANNLRRTPMALSDLIPLLQKAADKIEELEALIEDNLDIKVK